MVEKLTQKDQKGPKMDQKLTINGPKVVKVDLKLTK